MHRFIFQEYQEIILSLLFIFFPNPIWLLLLCYVCINIFQPNKWINAICVKREHI